MFITAMNYGNSKFCILIFIFSCIHLVQNYTLRGKPSLLLEVDKNGDPLPKSNAGAPDTIANDDEPSAPDSEPSSNKSDTDKESSGSESKEKGGKSPALNKVDTEDKSTQNTSAEAVDNGNEKPADSVGLDDEENDVAEKSQNQMQGDDEENIYDGKETDDVGSPNEPAGDDNEKSRSCWFPIEAHEHFIEMDKLDEKFATERREQRAANSKQFDKKMLTAMLKTRSIAERALQNANGDPNLIPAGLNLGGYCMMRMPQSVLFFHRLKLRNNTHFRVNLLENDLSNMLLTLRLSLNDLHLLGDYERATTYTDLSTLFYTPTYGELEFLLRDVEYKVEGRYRLLNDRLYVEHIISELQPKAILMRYMKENNTASMTTVTLERRNIQTYLSRMQNDLDLWLKDYFNDFLIYLDLPETNVNPQNQLYENEKTIARNRFADSVIKGVQKRLRQVNSSSIMIPDFKIYTVHEMEISLYDGVIRGLDSVYRRSVATGKIDKKNIRYLDTIVGFSSLKIEYKYSMFLNSGLPPLFGLLVVDADELTGRLALRVVRDSPTLDMHFELMTPVSEARSLIVEGPANRYIAKYKNILEHQISSIMSSTMIHYLQQLDSLARCNTLLVGKDDPKYKTIDDSESVETNNNNPSNSNKDDNDGGDTGDVTNADDEPVTEATDGGNKKQGEESAGEKQPEDYIVSKRESIELEFPPKQGDAKGEKMLLKVDEKFSLTKLKKDERRTG